MTEGFMNSEQNRIETDTLNVLVILIAMTFMRMEAGIVHLPNDTQAWWTKQAVSGSAATIIQSSQAVHATVKWLFLPA